MFFVAYRLKAEGPKLPARRPRNVAPWAWQASSTTARPCRSAIAPIMSMSATRPNRWTGTMALVRGVIAASIRFASMRYVSGSMSTKTGVAPVYRIAFAVAANVWLTVTTSSSGPRPRPAKIDMSATVPLLIAIA